MGTWATKHLSGMPLDQLKEYERILNRETIDIYNYVTAKEEPPADLRGAVMDSLQKHVASSPLGKANPEVRAWCGEVGAGGPGLAAGGRGEEGGGVVG